MGLKYWDGVKQFLGDSIGAVFSVPQVMGRNFTNAAIQQGFQKTNPQINTADLASNMNEATAAKNAATLQKAQEVANQAVNNFLTPVETIGAATAADSLLGVVDSVWQKTRPIVTRPIAVNALAAADLWSGEGLKSLGEYWNESAKIGPGQAISNAYSKQLGELGITDYAQKQGLNLPTFLDPNFNIADPIARKKAFEEEVFGRVISGGIDGTIAWFADPLVIGGKAIAATRRIALVRPINSYDDVVNLRSDLDVHGMFIKTGGEMGRQTPIGMVAERLVGKSPAEVLTEPIAKESTNRRLVARFAGNAKSYDDVADFLAASMGDRTSMNKLRQNQISVAEEIERNQEILTNLQKDLINVDWGAGSIPEKILAKDAEKVRLSKVLEDLKQRDENLRVALSENIGDYRIISNLTTGIDKTILGKNIGIQLEKLRAKVASAEHNLTFFTKSFSDNWLGTKVSSIGMAWNKLPNGIVRVDGGPLADSATEVKAILNSIPEFRVGTNAVESANALELKTQLLDNYISATSALERRSALKDIEQVGVEMTAKRYGFNAEEARRMFRDYDTIRTRLMDDLDSVGSVLDDNGDIVTSPFWKSEMPNVVPVLDFEAFDKFLAAHKGIFPKAAIGKRLVADELAGWSDTLNSFFKVSVLTRVGYPIRNTIEGQMRIATVLDSMVKADDLVYNFSKNVVTRAKIAGQWATRSITLTNPRQLNSRIGKLIESRNGFIQARESILNGLTKDEYYAGASGVFGKKIEKQVVEDAILSETLLKEADTYKYIELKYKMEKQDGLLYGKDHTEYLRLLNKAYRDYVKKEVVPTLPKDTTLVYADSFGGGIYYKVEGKRLPKAAVGDFETRRGIPAQELGRMEGPVKGVNVRGKEPSPDIRVVTTYEKSRAGNYEDLAEILGEDAMMRIRIFTDRINATDLEISNLIEESTKLNAARQELKILRSGEKPVPFILPNGKKIEFEGAFQGPAGDLKRAEASGAKTINWAAERDNYTTFDALKGGIKPFQQGYFTGKTMVVAPTDPNYWVEMSRIANNIFRNDQLATRILLGQSDQEIASWLLSKNGKFYLREIDADVKKDEVLLHIQEARSRVHRTIPDPLIRQLVAREELNAQQFEILMRDIPNLEALAGQEFLQNGLRYGRGQTRRYLQEKVSKVINFIGATPEDRLVSWPFYNRLYKDTLSREMRIAQRAGKDVSDPDWMIQAQRTAHDQARTTLNKTLYRIYNNTGMSSFFRFVVPFFNAQYNALWFWSKTFAKDPSKLARASMLWNSPNRIATVVDEDGNEVPPGAGPSTPQYLMFVLSPEQRKSWNLPTGYNLYIPKNSLNIFLQGENPILPSLGLPILMPMSALANYKPSIINNIDKFVTEIAGKNAADLTLRTILPFGRAAKEPATMAFPAWAQKLLQVTEGEDNIAYAQNLATAMKINDNEWRNAGMKGARPGLPDAIKLANQMYKIRIAANLTLPFAITFKPEWQNITNDYIKAIKDPNIGPAKVFDYLYEKWGLTGLYVTAPTSRTETGVIKTIGAVRNAEKYKSLLAKFDKSYQRLPVLAGFIANYGSTASGGEDYSANYFTDRRLRSGGKLVWSESKSAADVVEDREIQIGWWAYQKAKLNLNIAMAEDGISDINSVAAEDAGYKDKWETYVKSLEQAFPTWGKAYRAPMKTIGNAEAYVKGLTTIVKDQKWMADNGNTPGAKAIVSFLENRTALVNELQSRKSDGGSANIANESNSDLMEKWTKYIQDLSIYSVEFNDLYSRVLENDKLGVIK